MKRIIPLLALVALVLAAALAYAAPQRMGKFGRMPAPERIAAVLEKAGCPLTTEQSDKIKALEPGKRGSGALRTILTDAQKQAIRESLRKGPGARGSMKGKMHRPMAGIAGKLNKAGHPLTTVQLAKIKALKPGPGVREQIKAILTPEQLDVLKQTTDTGNTDTSALEKSTGAQETPKPFNLLKQNYPNPFNPSTTIEYTLARPGMVKVEIFSSSGQKVATLVNESQAAGMHTVPWNAGSLAAGTYICTITAGDFTQSRRMTLLK